MMSAICLTRNEAIGLRILPGTIDQPEPERELLDRLAERVHHADLDAPDGESYLVIPCLDAEIDALVAAIRARRRPIPGDWAADELHSEWDDHTAAAWRDAISVLARTWALEEAVFAAREGLNEKENKNAT